MVAWLLAVAAMAAGPVSPPTHLFGVQPGMLDREVRERLVRAGTLTRGDGTHRQTWELRDPRYRYLIVRFDATWRVKWLTALARPGGRKVRYAEIGDLVRARRAGFYSYVWALPDPSGGASLIVSAQGSDSAVVGSLSLTREARGRPRSGPAPASDSVP